MDPTRTTEQLGEMLDELRALRHELHRHPDLSSEEGPTARRVVDALVPHRPDELLEDLGGTGVAAIYDGAEPGPTVVLRADLDAVPVEEPHDRIAHGSTRAGVAHKCGHDGHITNLVGVAGLLARERPPRGRVVLLFQPAEETGDGAPGVLLDPRFPALEPDRVIGLHNLPGFPRGAVVLRGGTFANASCGLLVEFEGASCHSSQPHVGRDPMPAALHLAATLPRFPVTLLPPTRKTSVCVGWLRVGGRCFGVAPGTAELAATFRAEQDEDLDILLTRAEELFRETAAMHRLDVEISRHEPFPAVVNRDEASLALVERAAQALGIQVVTPERAFAWSEDFAHYLLRYPGVFFGMGSGEEHPGLHTRDYDYPDELIVPAAAMLHTTALAALEEES